jgi:hypothetical protein
MSERDHDERDEDADGSGLEEPYALAWLGPGGRLAVVVGLAAAIGTAIIASPETIPRHWIAAVLPGISDRAIDLWGGADVEITLRGAEPSSPWREQLAARLAPSEGRLKEESGRLVVEMPGASHMDAAIQVTELLRPGRLEMRQVQEGSAVMKRLVARAGGDPRAADLGVTGATDEWQHDSSDEIIHDRYLRAGSRSDLETYLREAAQADSSLAAEPGFTIALGEETERDGSSETTFWRTHYLLGKAELDNRHLARAFVYWAKMANRPEVMVELTPEGGRRFGDWTARLVGKKIAVLLDGAVSSAPVVQARIDGGRTSITMGAGTPEELQREASSLVAALTTQLLPFRAEVVAIVEVPPKVTPLHLKFARVFIPLAVGLALTLMLLLLGRRTREIDPDVDPVDELPSRAVAWRKLIVTGFGIVLAALAGTVGLPGINRELFAELAPSAGPGEPIGLFVLGIGPVLTAFILVELVALAVPPWRRLRTGGPAERGRLAPAVAILSLVIAVVQAWFLVAWLRALGHDGASGWGVDALPGGGMVVYQTVGLLLAGTIALTILALLVDRFGLGNGFVAVLLGGMATSAVSIFRWLAGDETWLDERLGVGVGIALAVILTSGILRWRLRARSAASVFRLPTGGMVPYAFPAAAIGLLSLSFAAIPASFARRWGELTSGAGALGQLAILVVAGAALSWLFSRPSRLGATATVLDRKALRVLWRGFARATLVSIIYLCALFAVERLLSATAGSPDAYFAVPVAATAFATAAIMDLIAEWRAFARRDDLVPTWPLHQLQLAGAVTAALTRNEIDVHARGLYLRSLLHFFGPFVPILLMVPADRRDEAAAIIRAQLDAPLPSAPLRSRAATSSQVFEAIRGPSQDR